MISINSPDNHKLGSSGSIPENLEIKICDMDGHELSNGQKGEIVIRGENVMKGYWKNKEATEETIIKDWLYTGDMGYLDKDGFLYVLGRYKSLLIADDGEKYSPEGIEETFTDQSEYIEQCILHNNQNPFTTCILYPSKSALKRYLESKGIDHSSDEGIEAAINIIDSEIREYRINGKYGQMFPQRWIPATIGIIPEGFTIENKLMNPTYKIIRPKVTEHFESLLEFLYTPEAKDVRNRKNREAMKQILNN
jgi:long-chain acyl-CoA synthetase